MTNGYIGKSAGDLFVPYNNAFTQRSKVLTLVAGTAPVITNSGLVTWTTQTANFFFYADSNGIWKMNFNFSGICAAEADTISDVTFTIASVVTKNIVGSKQACRAVVFAGATAISATAYMLPNSGSVVVTFPGNATGQTEFAVSGEVELNAETVYTSSTVSNYEGNSRTSGASPIGNATLTTSGAVGEAGDDVTVGGNKTFTDDLVANGTVNVDGYVDFFKNLNLDTIDGSKGWMDGPAGTGNDDFYSGILCPSGKVFCVPYNYTGTKVIYNPTTNLMEDGPAGPIAYAFAGGVLLPSGKVFAISHVYSGTKVIYNPTTNLMEDGPAGPIAAAFMGGVLLPNGKVFCVPYLYTGTKTVYNPTTNAYEDGPAGPIDYAFAGGVLLPNGKVFAIPNRYVSTKTIYNPTTNAWEDGPIGPRVHAFRGGVLCPNGKVFCVPYLYTGTKTVYNPTTNLMEDGPAAPGSGAFYGGVLLPNGKVFCIPSAYVGTDTIYNPITNAWEAGPAILEETGFSGGVLLPSGKVFCVLGTYTGTKTIYNPGSTTRSVATLCLHPAFNKL